MAESGQMRWTYDPVGTTTYVSRGFEASTTGENPVPGAINKNNQLTLNKTFYRNTKMNNKAYHFKVALWAIAISILVFSAAFFTEDKNATGFIVSDDSVELPKANPILLNNANSLSQLSPGNYYIDMKGNVQWMDDSSRPVIAKLVSYNENELDRSVYVSIEGEVFFVR